MRDHFSDIESLVAAEDPEGAETDPYELMVPGEELPPTFMPLGGELRPSQIAAAKRGSTKLLWRPQGETSKADPQLARGIFEQMDSLLKFNLVAGA